MRTVLARVALLLVLTGAGCSWFGGSSVPDATVVEVPHIAVQLDAPKAWQVQQQEQVGRALLYVGARNDRNHVVLVQKLSSHKSWRDHVDDFREGQEHALDKIVKESEHDIQDGGVVFETRQEREGHPVVRKLRYYVEIGDDTYLLDMGAPEASFDAGLYRAVAKTLRPIPAP